MRCFAVLSWRLSLAVFCGRSDVRRRTRITRYASNRHHSAARVEVKRHVAIAPLRKRRVTPNDGMAECGAAHAVKVRPPEVITPMPQRHAA